MKLVISNADLTDSFFDEARLLGIMAALRDYQFCWQLNNLLGMDFRINNEIEIQLTKKKRNYFFAVYQYAEPTNALVHYLYNNRFDGEHLLPEFKHLDFLWLLKGDRVTDDVLSPIVESIRSVKGVQLVAELTYYKIQNKEHLIF